MKVDRLGGTFRVVGADRLEEVRDREVWGDLIQDPERPEGAKVRSQKMVAWAIRVCGDGGVHSFHQEAVVFNKA